MFKSEWGTDWEFHFHCTRIFNSKFNTIVMIFWRKKKSRNCWYSKCSTGGSVRRLTLSNSRLNRSDFVLSSSKNIVTKSNVYIKKSSGDTWESELWVERIRCILVKILKAWELICDRVGGEVSRKGQRISDCLLSVLYSQPQRVIGFSLTKTRSWTRRLIQSQPVTFLILRTRTHVSIILTLTHFTNQLQNKCWCYFELLFKRFYFRCASVGLKLSIIHLLLNVLTWGWRPQT